MSHPGWTHVESSALTDLAYDEETETLLIRFPNGSEYAYEHVTKAEYAGFTTAGSVGQYFNQVIRPGHTFLKIREAK